MCLGALQQGVRLVAPVAEVRSQTGRDGTMSQSLVSSRVLKYKYQLVVYLVTSPRL